MFFLTVNSECKYSEMWKIDLYIEGDEMSTFMQTSKER